MSGCVAERDLREQEADEMSIEAMCRVEALARHVVLEAEKVLRDLYRANALRSGRDATPPERWTLVARGESRQ